MTTPPSADDLLRCPALVPPARLQIDRVRGEAVLLYGEGIIELNATSHSVLMKCDGQTTIAAIIEQLAAEYDAAPGELEADVLELLQALQERQLLRL